MDGKKIEMRSLWVYHLVFNGENILHNQKKLKLKGGKRHEIENDMKLTSIHVSNLEHNHMGNNYFKIFYNTLHY